MARISGPWVVVAVMIEATNLLMRIQEHSRNIKKTIQPLVFRGLYAQEYAAGKQVLLYILACRPSLSISAVFSDMKAASEARKESLQEKHLFPVTDYRSLLTLHRHAALLQ